MTLRSLPIRGDETNFYKAVASVTGSQTAARVVDLGVDLVTPAALEKGLQASTQLVGASVRAYNQVAVASARSGFAYSLGGAADDFLKNVKQELQGARPSLAAEVRVEAGFKRVAATPELAMEIQGDVPLRVQTITLMETAEGPTIAAGGALMDLTAEQRALASQRGLLIAEDLPGFHAELTATYTAGQRGLLPTRGVTTNGMCADGPYSCYEQLAGMARRGGFELRLSADRRSYVFVKPGG